MKPTFNNIDFNTIYFCGVIIIIMALLVAMPLYTPRSLWTAEKYALLLFPAIIMITFASLVYDELKTDVIKPIYNSAKPYIKQIAVSALRILLIPVAPFVAIYMGIRCAYNNRYRGLACIIYCFRSEIVWRLKSYTSETIATIQGYRR